MAEEDKNVTHDRWGAQGKRESIVLGAIELGGDKKLK